MKSTEPERNGSFSDTDLAADCDVRADNLADNLDALRSEGMSDEMITEFRAEILAFRQLPSEVNLSAAVTTAVEARDASLEAARTGLRTAVAPIRRAFGDESPVYKGFNVGEVSHKTVSQVLTLLQMVPIIGQPYLTDPKAQAEGFDAERLAPLAGLYADLFQKEAAVTKAETVAVTGTRTRVLAYNALNTKCSAYCARGYDHFVELDRTLAQLFVRHPASHPAPKPTPPVPPGA